MKTLALGVGLVLLFVIGSVAHGAEARLVRYPHYHNGKVAFTYWATSGRPTNAARTSSG